MMTFVWIVQTTQRTNESLGTTSSVQTTFRSDVIGDDKEKHTRKIFAKWRKTTNPL